MTHRNLATLILCSLVLVGCDGRGSSGSTSQTPQLPPPNPAPPNPAPPNPAPPNPAPPNPSPPLTATTLRVLDQPMDVDTRAGLGLVRVEAVDSNGNRVDAHSGSVSVALTTNGLGTLKGTVTSSFASGIATFNDLSVDRSAGTNTLTFTSSGLSDVVSNSFVVRSKATVRVVGLLIFPPSWSTLTTTEVILDGRGFIHESAVTLGAGLASQQRIEYLLGRGPGTNWFWTALGAYGSFRTVTESDGRLRLDFTDPTTRQTVLSYLQSKQAEWVFFDSIDKPLQLSGGTLFGDTPGLALMIADIIAAGHGTQVTISGGGWNGTVGLSPTHPWRRDARIVVGDESLDAEQYVEVGRIAVGVYMLFADFSRHLTPAAALEHEVELVAAVLVLDAEFGVEAWLSTTVSASQRTFQGTREIQSFDYGSVNASPTTMTSFAGVQASGAVTFHQRQHALVVHNTTASPVTLTVPATLFDFAAGGALITAQPVRVLPPGGVWVWPVD